MGYQFFHIESYARVAGKDKAGGHSIKSILAEAKREVGACPHVEEPEQPVLRYGDFNSIETLANEWAEEAKDAIGRKLRKDGLCMVAGVFSAPDDMTDNEWERYRNESIEWLKNRYGERLRCVIEHLDEKNRHCHFYCVAKIGEKFEVLHDGKDAVLKAKEAGVLKKGDQNRIYKEAMRKMQNRFWDVSRKFGLARIGPKRRRLTRAQWQIEQMNARLIKEAHEEVKNILADADKAANKALEKAEKEVERIKKKSLVQKEEWSNARKSCLEERRLLAIDRKEAENRNSFFGRIGSAYSAIKEKVVNYKELYEQERVKNKKLQEVNKNLQEIFDDEKLKNEIALNSVLFDRDKYMKKCNSAIEKLFEYKKAVKVYFEKNKESKLNKANQISKPSEHKM